jgi:hypothetical protein
MRTTSTIGLWVLLVAGFGCVSPKQDAAPHKDAEATKVDETDNPDETPPATHRDGPTADARGDGGSGGSGGAGGTGGDEPSDGPTKDGPVDVTPSTTCTANVACTQGLMPCRKGTTSCASATSQPVCTDVGADDSAGGCPGGNVCKNGACVLPCASGVACTQGIAPCHRGATFCASPGSDAECHEAGVDDSRGGCTGGQVCKNGDCVGACKANVACTAGLDPCRKGKTTCASPTAEAVCKDSGADDSANTCGSGKICKGGMCCSSKVGQNCVGNNPCQTGTYDCSGVCQSMPVNGPCGTGAGCVNNATKAADFCQSGQCVHVTSVNCPSDQTCSNNKCIYPKDGLCDINASPDLCAPGTTCQPWGVCTADPFPGCLDNSMCPNGGHCVSLKPPEYRCK